MNRASGKPFIPRDKPKSWVLMTISILVAAGVAAPLMWVAGELGLLVLHKIALAILYGAIATGLAMGGLFLVRFVSGKYSWLEERPWSKQVW